MCQVSSFQQVNLHECAREDEHGKNDENGPLEAQKHHILLQPMCFFQPFRVPCAPAARRAVASVLPQFGPVAGRRVKAGRALRPPGPHATRQTTWTTQTKLARVVPRALLLLQALVLSRLVL